MERYLKEFAAKKTFQVIVVKDWFDEIFNFNVQSAPI